MQDVDEPALAEFELAQHLEVVRIRGPQRLEQLASLRRECCGPLLQRAVVDPIEIGNAVLGRITQRVRQLDLTKADGRNLVDARTDPPFDHAVARQSLALVAQHERQRRIRSGDLDALARRRESLLGVRQAAVRFREALARVLGRFERPEQLARERGIALECRQEHTRRVLERRLDVVEIVARRFRLRGGRRIDSAASILESRLRERHFATHELAFRLDDPHPWLERRQLDTQRREHGARRFQPRERRDPICLFLAAADEVARAVRKRRLERHDFSFRARNRLAQAARRGAQIRRPHIERGQPRFRGIETAARFRERLRRRRTRIRRRYGAGIESRRNRRALRVELRDPRVRVARLLPELTHLVAGPGRRHERLARLRVTRRDRRSYVLRDRLVRLERRDARFDALDGERVELGLIDGERARTRQHRQYDEH